jgi:predicted nucleic acid-binding Zn ribbon protein
MNELEFAKEVNKLVARNRKRKEKEEIITYVLILLFALLVAFLLILWAEKIDASDDIWKDHPNFSSTSEYVRYSNIIAYHGDVAVATDFSHFIRLNGEIVYNKGRW